MSLMAGGRTSVTLAAQYRPEYCRNSGGKPIADKGAVPRRTEREIHSRRYSEYCSETHVSDHRVGRIDIRPFPRAEPLHHQGGRRPDHETIADPLYHPAKQQDPIAIRKAASDF